MNGMISNMNVLVMFSNPYELKDDETKEIRRGLSVEYYIYGKNGEGLAPVADSGSGNLGIRRSKCTMDYEMKERLMYVPGIYDGQFEMTVGSDGKPTLKLVDINFVGKCNMVLDAGFSEPKTDKK